MCLGPTATRSKGRDAQARWRHPTPRQAGRTARITRRPEADRRTRSQRTQGRALRREDHPIFELIEGEGDKAVAHPLFSIPEILAEDARDRQERRADQAVQRPGRNECEGALRDDDESRQAQAPESRSERRQRRRGRPDVHDPDGRCRRAAPPVHRGQRAECPDSMFRANPHRNLEAA